MSSFLPLLAQESSISALTADQMPNFGGLLPEIFLCVMVVAVLVVDLFRNRGPSGLYPKISMAAIAIAGFLVFTGDPTDAELLRIGYGDFAALSADGLSRLFKLIFLGTGFATVLFVGRSGEEYGNEAELYVLLLAALAGMCYLASATDVISFYLAFETVSYTGFLMAGYRLQSAKGAEASGKFVIFGSVASAVMLFGISLVYGFTGSLDFATIATELSNAGREPALIVAAIFVFGGFAFKAAAFPFQFWCPDVYEGAPTPIAAFLAVASKAAVFAVGLRALSLGTPFDGSQIESLGSLFNLSGGSVIQNVLIGASVATMTWGNLAALRQTSVQRMLAYSSIGHAGYLLMTCAVIGGSTNIESHTAMSAVVFYFVIYLFMTLGAFFIVTLMGRDTGSVEMSALRGAGWRHPVLGTCFALILFSLTGLPPTAGFVGKFLLFAPVIKEGLYLLAAIGLVNGAISLYYYAKPLREMYFSQPDEDTKPFRMAGMDVALLVVMTVPLLVLGLFGWDTLSNAAMDAVAMVK